MDRSATDIGTSLWSGSQPMCPMHRAPTLNDRTISIAFEEEAYGLFSNLRLVINKTEPTRAAELAQTKCHPLHLSYFPFFSSINFIRLE